MREEYVHHYSGDVITLISYWSDPNFEWMYNCQATCKALYPECSKSITMGLPSERLLCIWFSSGVMIGKKGERLWVLATTWERAWLKPQHSVAGQVQYQHKPPHILSMFSCPSACTLLVQCYIVFPFTCLTLSSSTHPLTLSFSSTHSPPPLTLSSSFT